MKQKSLLFIILFFGIVNILYAQNINERTILQCAENYLKFINKTPEKNILYSLPEDDSKSYYQSIMHSKFKDPIAYVVELEPKGFIVFSGAKELFPVISYSTDSDFDYERRPENVLLDMLITDLSCQFLTLENGLNEDQKKVVQKNINAWDKIQKGVPGCTKSDSTYGPHLSSIWGGVNCYDDDTNSVYVGNYYTPNNYSPGCVATSMSQILHYFEWPTTGVGNYSYYDSYGSSTGTYSADFSSTTYDWSNMLDEYYYKPSTDTERSAMGKIAYHCGVSIDMDYEYDGSTSNINKVDDALADYFRFVGHYETSSWSYFWTRLDENLENGFPVQLAIYSSGGAGHAIACDGYKFIDGDQYYHLNMGWWGTCNAWYRIQNSFSACGYSIVNSAVFDILPEPIMGDVVRTSDEKVFTVTWNVSKKLTWDAFELQQQQDNGAWTTISNSITDTSYQVTVTEPGEYNYRVRAKSNGYFYYDSYSEEQSVLVKDELIFLDFDGNDSFFVNDNSDNDLDVSSEWTIEAWVNVDSHTSGEYAVILDRRTVFSMYLIDDSNADYAIRFVTRNSSGSIIASLRSDNSDVNLNYGEWVHVAVSRIDGTARLFLNGVEIEESTDSDFSLTSSTNALNVGARYWGSYSRYIDGKIDEIRISQVGRYTKDFTVNHEDIHTTDADTRLLLNLQEGTGSALTDSSANFTGISLRSSPNDPDWMFESISSKSTYVTTDIEPIAENSEIIVFPNPVSDNKQLYIRLAGTAETQVEIFDLAGKMVYHNKLLIFENENKLIDLNSLRSGMYLYRIKTPNEINSGKLLLK